MEGIEGKNKRIRCTAKKLIFDLPGKYIDIDLSEIESVDDVIRLLKEGIKDHVTGEDVLKKLRKEGKKI